MRLIDADALMNTIIKKSYTVTDYWNTRDAGMFLVGIEQAINEQPTIEERKKGKWIVHLGGKYVGFPCAHYECSECHAYMPDNTNFCPNCGADMRGEEDE